MDGKELDIISNGFKLINEKLEELSELANKTALHEYRIHRLEEEMNDMKKNRRDTVWRVLAPGVSALVSSIVTYIIAGGFLIK